MPGKKTTRKKSNRVDITKTQIRKRQFPPGQCRKGTFRTKKVSPRTSLVLCKKKGERKISVQSIRHPRKKVKKRKTKKRKK